LEDGQQIYERGKLYEEATMAGNGSEMDKHRGGWRTAREQHRLKAKDMENGRNWVNLGGNKCVIFNSI
jgi:hypothetical protein